MKLLMVQPGASYSTADVYDGMLRELQILGHDIIRYNLDTRIARASGWLNYCWEEAKKENENIVQPMPNDVVYLASSESVLMALRHMPDWVVVFSGMYFHPDALIMLKRARMNVALIMTESPYDDARQFNILPYADVVFCNDKYSVDAFSELHRQVHYLPHAYDPSKHAPDTDDNDDVPAHDVVFVGTGFRERIELLAGIDWTGIDLGLYGTYDLFEDMPVEAAKLEPFMRGEVVSNAYAASLYRKAKIGLNIHRTSMGFGMDVPKISRAYSMNPRMYELAANGCFIATDYRTEVVDVFQDSLPVFQGAEDAEALIRYYLAHDEKRIAVSTRLLAMVAPHTFTARARQVSRTLISEGESTWRDTTGGKVSSMSPRQEAATLAQPLR
jgi:hypothetical protein